MADMMKKMTFLEDALVQQRKKSLTLESQLSAAQDRIGGAERRAKALEDENVQIKGELQSWNEYYEQENDVVTPSATTISSPMFPAAPTVMSEPLSITSSLPVPMPPISLTWHPTPHVSDLIPSGSSNILGESNPFGTLDDDALQSVQMPVPNQQPDTRRVSFGSVFPGSSVSGGNGRGNGNSGGLDLHSTRVPQGSGSTFQIGIKPKDPPVFYGRANETLTLGSPRWGISSTSLRRIRGNKWHTRQPFSRKQQLIGGWRCCGKDQDVAQMIGLNLPFCWLNDLAVAPGLTGQEQSCVTSAKVNQKQCAATPQGLNPFWANCQRLIANGPKPSSCGDCTKEWLNW